MDFTKIANNRYSCRKYDTNKPIENEKIEAILKAGLLSPSACNGQPYHITVLKGDLAKKVARTTKALKINGFVEEAPVLLVISEKPYSKLAALGAKHKNNDYRSIDIGILSAYLTAEATAQGLGSCIIGWLDSDKICEITGIDSTVRLIISLGYPLDEMKPKKRKPFNEMVTFL